MKKSNLSEKYLAQIVCTDGSIIDLDFPYIKKPIFLTNDLKNTFIYSSPLNKSFKTTDKNKSNKFKNFDFNFHTHLRHQGNKEHSKNYLKWETNLIKKMDKEERDFFN